MVTTGKERQAALAERRRAAGLVQVAAWVPASRKADLQAFAKGLCDDAAQAAPPSPPVAAPAPTLPAPRPTDVAVDSAAVTTDEPVPWSSDKIADLRKQVKAALAQKVAKQSSLTRSANIPSSVLRSWLKGKMIKHQYFPQIEAALNNIIARRDRALGRTTEGA